MGIQVTRGQYNQIGARRNGTTMNFCFEALAQDDCKILILNKRSRKLEKEIPVGTEYGIGNLRAVQVKGIHWERYGYCYEINGVQQLDPYCACIYGRDTWADESRIKELKQADTDGITERMLFCGFETEAEEAGGKLFPGKITKENLFLYKLNVHTFTMEDTSVSRGRKGTFAGLTDKIPYLKELGVTAVECMPVYEFEEWMVEKEPEVRVNPAWKVKDKDQFKPVEAESKPAKINCWGYTDGFYFAPKASYAASKDAQKEFAACVDALHENGISIILEFYMIYPKNPDLILQALRYWVTKYHVDGFHLIGLGIPMDGILADPLLRQTVILSDHFTDQQKEDNKDRVFLADDEFLYQIRRLLNQKGGHLLDALCQMRKQGETCGYVNYLAYNNGFTLADTFMYEMRHNEANGEDNQDGIRENFSSNCGVEGESRKKLINQEREQRMRNALALLFLSQGAPMLMAGDEEQNSKQGNNNTYCQDNRIGWVNWKKTKAAAEQQDFVRRLMKLRMAHPVLHMAEPMQRADYKRIGSPDLSYHGEGAWLSDVGWDENCVGCLYNGEYAGQTEQVYIGMNFSSRRRKLALPECRGYGEWQIALSTAVREEAQDKVLANQEKWLSLESGTIVILTAEKLAEETQAEAKETRNKKPASRRKNAKGERKLEEAREKLTVTKEALELKQTQEAVKHKRVSKGQKEAVTEEEEITTGVTK